MDLATVNKLLTTTRSVRARLDLTRAVPPELITETELTEVILHLMGYVGAPLVRDAMLVARQTFAEVKKEAAG